FADIGRIVTVSAENVAEAFVLRTETEFVDYHTRARLVFSGEQRSAIRSANGRGWHRLPYIERLLGQPIYMRRVGELIPREAARKPAELIGKNVDEIRWARLVLRRGRGAGRHLPQKCPTGDVVHITCPSEEVSCSS